MTEHLDSHDPLVQYARQRLHDHYRSARFWDEYRGRRLELAFKSFMLGAAFSTPGMLVVIFVLSRFMATHDSLAAELALFGCILVGWLAVLRWEYRAWIRIRDELAEGALLASVWDTACSYMRLFGRRARPTSNVRTELEDKVLKRMVELGGLSPNCR